MSSASSPIDVINGSPLLREWVDDPTPTPATWTHLAIPDEQAWDEEPASVLAH